MEIKSVSDVITNSSSEAFVIKKEDSDRIKKEYSAYDDCIHDTIIGDISNIIENLEWESDILTDAAGISEQFDPDWEVEDREAEWTNFVIKHEEEFSKLSEYVILDVEDHFADYDLVYDDARSACLAVENRH